MKPAPIDPTTIRILRGDGLPTAVVAGDYADEGEPDLFIVVTAEDDLGVATVIANALRTHYETQEVTT